MALSLLMLIRKEVMEDHPKFKVIKCWCVPPDQVYFINGGNPCTYPDCINGAKDDPMEFPSPYKD